MSLFTKLLALAGMAQQNALDTIDSGYRLSELALTGSPDEFSKATNEFFALQHEAAAIACQTFATVFTGQHEQPPEPRVVRKRTPAAA
jgi:hypothetical protein